ncbi:MAG: putative porin, partial [Sulfurimonas sp.]|nr:putative porin [Sulfurimonas sp.]
IGYKFGDSWIQAGKSKHFYYRPNKTQLIWDNDIRLEGLNYGYKNSKRIALGINKIHRLKNHEESIGEIYMYTAQYMQPVKFDNYTLNVGAGFYYYDGVKANTAPYKSGLKGNSEDVNGHYAYNYRIAESFAELKFKDVFGKDLSVAVICAYNTAVSKNNLAYELSMQLGSTKNVYDWKIAYAYKDTEADAVFGAHSDSDFSGSGTGGKGHIIQPKMKVAKNVYIGGHFQWSKFEKGISKQNIDYRRTQLDLTLKF